MCTAIGPQNQVVRLLQTVRNVVQIPTVVTILIIRQALNLTTVISRRLANNLLVVLL